MVEVAVVVDEMIITNGAMKDPIIGQNRILRDFKIKIIRIMVIIVEAVIMVEVVVVEVAAEEVDIEEDAVVAVATT